MVNLVNDKVGGSDVNMDFTFKAKNLAFTQQILTCKIKPLLLSRLHTDCDLTSMFRSK